MQTAIAKPMLLRYRAANHFVAMLAKILGEVFKYTFYMANNPWNYLNKLGKAKKKKRLGFPTLNE